MIHVSTFSPFGVLVRDFHPSQEYQVLGLNSVILKRYKRLKHCTEVLLASDVYVSLESSEGSSDHEYRVRKLVPTLALVIADEVPATMPKINDDETSNPFASCDDNGSEQTVRGTLLVRPQAPPYQCVSDLAHSLDAPGDRISIRTLLTGSFCFRQIPCKTAMRGWFPLNGTYFQVNEVR